MHINLAILLKKHTKQGESKGWDEMTDVDFDEIDKAVASAMSDPKPSADEEKETDTPSKSESRPPLSVDSGRSSAPAARRSGGRFMDVVHPSSDMKPKSARPAPFASDHHTPKPSYSYPSGNVQPDETIDQPEETTTSDEPVTTPFLTDAKVEKRPLGAFSSVQSESPLPSDSNDEQVTDEQSQPQETSVDTQQPEQPSQEAEEVKLLEEHNPPDEEQTEPASPIPPSDSQTQTEATPPVPSIIQQYQEKESSVSDQSGAIFDTEHYHTPLAHPAKKKTGWLVVLWILILIIIGSGLGVVAYYFVLPTVL